MDFEPMPAIRILISISFSKEMDVRIDSLEELLEISYRELHRVLLEISLLTTTIDGRRKIRPKMHFTHVCRMVQTLTTAKTQHGGIAI